MPDEKSENVKAERKIGVLRLKRETLRVLDAGELKQVQGGPGATGHGGFTCYRCTFHCYSFHCK